MNRFPRLGIAGKVLVAAAVGGVLFGVATAVQASIPDSSGVIHGCYNTSLAHGSPTGALRVIDTAKVNGNCAAWEAPLNWNQAGATGARGPTGPVGLPEYAYIYDLSPPDIAATVGAGTDVPFAHNGPKTAGITYAANGQITIATAGVYRIEFIASVTEPGQLELTQNGVQIPSTVYGRATGTSEISGQATLSVAAGDILTLRNPSGNSPALTFTPTAGGTHADVSASILIQQLGA
jgi:hypothetical protein